MDALRTDGQQPVPAMLPDETPGPRHIGLVDAVEGNDGRAGTQHLRQRSIAAIGGPQRRHVDAGGGDAGLERQMPGHVALVHGGDRMAGHDRMPVEPEDAVATRGEEVPEGLVAPHGRRSEQRGYPGPAQQRRGELDGMADRADLGRGIEGRADLVVREGGAQAGQGGEDVRQVPIHPCGRLRAGNAGDADGAGMRKGCQLLGRRHIEEEDRFNTAKAQDFHDGRRAGVVVAVPGEEPPVRQPGGAHAR